ncbi:hypothetical protein, partial [Halorubrum sp. ASP121]|uniref:hypothetical protein n=1 Tax=Halorubrum sp. ASP121 TaxID=1855858 RepID=UPI0013050C21
TDESGPEVSTSVAVDVAEDYTWKQCSVDWISDYHGVIHLDCCNEYVSEDGVTFRACEDIRVFQNDSTGGMEVRN